MGNKPRIRFKGFTEDWEQRKLNDFGIATGGTSIESEFVDEGAYKVISIGSYSEESVYNDQGLRVNKTEKTKSRILNKDDLTMILNDKTSSGNIIGRVLLIDQDNTYVYNQRTERIEVDTKNFLPMFLYHMLNAPEQRKYIVKASQGNTQIYVNWSTISNINYMIPTLPAEQEKIAYLFSLINKDITLHQCKLEKLKLTKKALLQKLFPKYGKHIPEIRFKGFTDAWEQRKFLDLLDAQNGIRRGPFGSSLKKDSFVKKSDYVVYEQQNAIYDNYETRYFISKEKYNELIRFNIQPGDFIMSGAGTIGRISMVPDGIKKGVFNQALIRFKVNKDSINPLYFLKFMQSDMMQKQLTQANPGSAMTNLVPMDELKKWDVTIPSLEEQNRISTFINQIDAFITLHQRKLERLQEVKKGLLQKMFV